MTTGMRARDWISQNNAAIVVVLLLCNIMVTGVSDAGIVRLASGLINAAALIIGFSATREYRRIVGLGALLLAGILGSVVVSFADGPDATTALGALANVAVLGTLCVATTMRVATQPTVESHTIYGATAAYLLLGQVFAWIYLMLPGLTDESVLDPSQAGEVPIYYSYVVLTTLGFGDISPAGSLAQRITVVEALFGQLFIAILLSRLVSLYSTAQHEARAAANDAE